MNITLSKEAKLLCDEQLLDWQVIEQKDVMTEGAWGDNSYNYVFTLWKYVELYLICICYTTYKIFSS